MGQAALHRRSCSMQSVCEAVSAALVESVKGKSANIPIPGRWDTPGNRATNLGTAARTPVKSSLFLLMGSPDHGSESIERRWSAHPGQQRASTLWGRFVLPTENPGQHSRATRPWVFSGRADGRRGFAPFFLRRGPLRPAVAPGAEEERTRALHPRLSGRGGGRGEGCAGGFVAGGGRETRHLFVRGRPACPPSDRSSI
jgi:hypothetical protein